MAREVVTNFKKCFIFMLYVLFIHELRHPDWLVLAVTAREYAILPLRQYSPYSVRI